MARSQLPRSRKSRHQPSSTATVAKALIGRRCTLLDRDIYGSVESLEEAMRRHHAPFYLRRTKEAPVSFPNPDTGEVKKLFTKREVRTASFELDGDEYDFYASGL
jgi:hypothetical protein